MHDLLLQTLIEKVNILSKKIQETQNMIKALPDYSTAITDANNRMDGIQVETKTMHEKIAFPEKKIEELTETLQRHGEQLQAPMKQEIQHHHHIGWAIAIGLFLLAVSLILAYWLGRAVNQ